MEFQDVVNIGVGAILSVLGWFARQLWDAVQRLRDDLQRIEVDLPNTYVKKIDLDKRLDKLEDLLSKIHDKLEHKVDK